MSWDLFVLINIDECLVAAEVPYLKYLNPPYSDRENRIPVILEEEDKKQRKVEYLTRRAFLEQKNRNHPAFGFGQNYSYKYTNGLNIYQDIYQPVITQVRGYGGAWDPATSKTINSYSIDLIPPPFWISLIGICIE